MNKLVCVFFLFFLLVQPIWAAPVSLGVDPPPGARASGVGLKPRRPELGLGLRVGDPTGLTVKKYFGDNALEINLGRSYVWGWRGYYNGRYDDDWDFRGRLPLSLQVHYLWHNRLRGTPELSWYWGLGAQLRHHSYAVVYKNRGRRYEERYADYDLGLDFVLGLEYTFSSDPLSIFADVTPFVEVVDRPFYLWLQAGAGVRYNF
ncbi:MAG: hypothetical protein MUC97_04800 [Bernardetiaceae bacterium]|nr:hypothetical protein [Bernardetiaceae bacterium]